MLWRRSLDDALRSKLIANGFETAKQWQWEPSIDRLERYYQDVLAGRRGKTDSAVKQSADRAISQAQRSLSLNQNPQALAAQLAEKDALLASIYASTAWRLIQSLWRIRMALMPHGSRRERLWLRIKDRVQKFLSQN